MNIRPNNQMQPTDDDQELARVLAGASQGGSNLSFEETGSVPASIPVTTAPPVVTPPPVAPVTPVAPAPRPVTTATPIKPVITQQATAPATQASEKSLDSIKQAALDELRPLVDKLPIDAEERFNTYLMIIRSTDDKGLLAPAYEAAQAITDDTRRAQALLDVIKEIDYLSNQQ